MSTKNHKPEKTRDEPHHEPEKTTENLVDLEATEQPPKSIEELTLENQQLQKMISDLKNEAVKAKENQKKLILATKLNTLKEQEIQNKDFKKYANQDLFEQLIIPALQNFDQSLQFKINKDNFDSFMVGFKYIINNFKESAAKAGLSVIKIEKGMLFESRTCEVVETEEVTTLPTGIVDNTILEVKAFGYQLFNRVICPAKVKIIRLKTPELDQNKPQKTEME